MGPRPLPCSKKSGIITIFGILGSLEAVLVVNLWSGGHGKMVSIGSSTFRFHTSCLSSTHKNSIKASNEFNSMTMPILIFLSSK